MALEYIISGLVFLSLVTLWKRGRTIFVETIKHPLESTRIDIDQKKIKVKSLGRHHLKEN